MATNPVPIVVPCHRVLRSGRQLGNYGGGLEMKRRLLTHGGLAAGVTGVPALVRSAGRGRGSRCGRRSRSCSTGSGPASTARGLAEHDVDRRERGIDGLGAVGRRDQPVLHRQHDGGRLERAGGAEGVTGDALRRRDDRAGRAEHLGDGLGFGRVVERRRRAVRVDVHDVGRREPGVCDARAPCRRSRRRHPATVR